jgi:hypothetical protein
MLLCMLGWIFKRWATSSATALFGPWPDSSMCLAEVVHLRLIFGGRICGSRCGARHHRPQQQERGSSSPSSTRHGRSLTSSTDNLFCRTWASWGAQVAAIFYPNYDSFQWRLCQSRCPGTVVMVVRRNSRNF